MRRRNLIVIHLITAISLVVEFWWFHRYCPTQDSCQAYIGLAPLLLLPFVGLFTIVSLDLALIIKRVTSEKYNIAINWLVPIMLFLLILLINNMRSRGL